MFLAVDIGNSAIKFGLFEHDTLTSKFSIPTPRNVMPDEISSAVDGRLPSTIDSVFVCSVVPEIDRAIREFLNSVTGADPTFVTNSFDFGLKINYAPLDSLGTDRLVAAFAAVEKYGAPVIVCSLGTATTIDVVDADREFLGGVIAPGLDAMAEALHLKAARLPHVTIEKPSRLLGNSTQASIESGVYNGYLAMVGGLIDKIKDVADDVKVIATGGRAAMVESECRSIQIFDRDLVLEGMNRLGKVKE